MENTLHGERLEDFYSTLSERGFIHGVFEEEQLIAIAQITGSFEDSAIIGGVYVKPDFRGKGQSKKLVGSLLQHCQQANFQKALLHVGVDNDFALRSYDTLGFKGVAEFGTFMT